MKITKDIKIKEMKEALEKAEAWFHQFGCLNYGIKFRDNIKDPIKKHIKDYTEVKEAINFALRIEKMKENK